MKLLNLQVLNEEEEDQYPYLGVVALDRIREDKIEEKLTFEHKRQGCALRKISGSPKGSQAF